MAGYVWSFKLIYGIYLKNMAAGIRSPHERETLIFSTPERAEKFTERVLGRLEKVSLPGLGHKRQIVAEAIAQEFEREGEAVSLVRQPWEHTPQEHHEAQQLVDVAFAQDLPAAIRVARQSTHYPRNLDLLHDVLTGEMYQLVARQHLNRQPLGWSLWLAIGIVVITVVVLFFLFSR